MSHIDSIFERLQKNGEEREEAIAELRSLLVRGLSKSLNHRYGFPVQAEDIVQEALIRILNSLEQFQGRSKFTTWAMTIANRIGIAALRRKYVEELSLDLLSEENRSLSNAMQWGSLAQNELVRKEIIEKIQEVIDGHLSEKQQLVLRALLEGYSSDNLAELLGTNRNAVYKLVHDARMRLKEGLQEVGITADDVREVFA